MRLRTWSPSRLLKTFTWRCTDFDPVAGLALPDVVDGAVASKQVEADPAAMASRVKAMARRLGAADARIGPLNPAWVYSHRGTLPFFSDSEPNPPHFSGPPEVYRDLRYGDPIEVSHRHAVAMAFSQDLDIIRTGGTPFSDLVRSVAVSPIILTERWRGSKQDRSKNR